MQSIDKKRVKRSFRGYGVPVNTQLNRKNKKLCLMHDLVALICRVPIYFMIKYTRVPSTAHYPTSPNRVFRGLKAAESKQNPLKNTHNITQTIPILFNKTCTQICSNFGK